MIVNQTIYLFKPYYYMINKEIVFFMFMNGVIINKLKKNIVKLYIKVNYIKCKFNHLQENSLLPRLNFPQSIIPLRVQCHLYYSKVIGTFS
jgi:hypothetical protein